MSTAQYSDLLKSHYLSVWQATFRSLSWKKGPFHEKLGGHDSAWSTAEPARGGGARHAELSGERRGEGCALCRSGREGGGRRRGEWVRA